MTTEKDNIVEFPMSKMSRFVVFQFPIIGTIASTILFWSIIIWSFFQASFSLEHKLSGLRWLGGIWACCIILICFCVVILKKQRVPFKMCINKEKKEFEITLCFTNEKVLFNANDVARIENNYYSFNFYLKDGLSFDWGKDANNENVLKDITSSFGITIKNNVL